MKCPFCAHNDDKVLDTRIQKEGDVIRRRRECLECGSRFNTVETILRAFPLMIKKDGRLEEFNRGKIFGGLQAACQKRPVSLAQMEQIVENVCQWALDKGDKEISTVEVGHRVMTLLRGLDDVAYVRFASVYRTFADVQEFVSSLSPETVENQREEPLQTPSLDSTPRNEIEA